MYVELHARSAFSFLDGASSPEGLVEACAERNLPAMALLDRDGVYGAPRFHLAAQKAGIRAHIGAEVTATDGSRYPLLVATRAGYRNLCRLITRMKLRAAKGEGAVTEDELAEHAAGLICLVGGMDVGIRGSGFAEEDRDSGLGIPGLLCESRIPNPEPRSSQPRTPNPVPNPESRIDRLMGIFGRDNVYVELQRHFHRDEEANNQAAMEMARRLHLPLLATNGVCYASPDRRQVLDVFTCIRNHRRLENAGRLLARNSERYVKSAEEMARLFADLPEALAHTVELSSRLEFTLNDLGYEFPRYPTPNGETENQFLRQRTEEGMIWRYGPQNERARRQIERELALIEKLRLAGYFLIVWDIVQYCRRQNILAQGRGSAANSAVCYSLGITAVDPVGMDLLFERFLSEERGEWPDIDIDLPSGDQRERVIQYVYQHYGERGAAMTANVITYRGRSAAREVGKALGFDGETLDRLSSLVGAWEYRDPGDTLERHFRDAGLDLTHPRIGKFCELCHAVRDLPRHLGQHSGGMVVCQGRLDSVVPLEPATMPGRVVVQWDKEDCADMKIIKIDLLGLGMMAVLEESLQLIREHYGEEVDLAHLPQDDAAVYDALQRADTVGMFQVESRAQMSSLPRLRPKRFYDLVVQVAIIRPGPIVGNMVHPYLKRRQGREPVKYPHPSLEPVLARTLGVPLFQEQLLRMAMIAAGFTGGEAEDLRRAMGFKRSEMRMKEIEKKLRRGMDEKGIIGKAQDEIVQSIAAFALYGFPESHAASFALIAYASAYLKCHYPAAFTAALLNNQPMGFYSPAVIVKDAQRHGLRVRPIDVTRSGWRCTLERESGFGSRDSGKTGFGIRGPGFAEEDRDSGLGTRDSQRTAPDSRLPTPVFLRLGMNYVKGLRQEAAEAIVRERGAGPLSAIDDLAQRVLELRKAELVTLAEVGALNFMGARGRESGVGSRESGPTAADDARLPTAHSELPDSRLPTPEPRAPSPRHRRDALWQVERAARPAGELFEDSGRTEPAEDRAAASRQAGSPLAIMTPEERLVADFSGTGLTLGPHPMAYRRAEMKALGVRPAAELKRIPNGKQVRIAGAVIARQRPGTAKGFIFLSLEDETGIANAIITPDLFAENRLVIVGEQFLFIEGKLQNQDNVISVKAERVLPLSVTKAPTRSHDFY
ncbi:MAG TPA: error-prone DNA polymerase [Terriglobia bacterium]|nr:error-prone DNA polymerase [Terriglobia bacterium]